MKVCYFSTYYFPNYVRQRVILQGLKENNVEVIECIVSGKNPLRYLKALIKFIQVKKEADVIIVGFRGHEILPFIRFLTRKPIIFDAFISLYETLCLDQKKISKESVFGKFLKWYDKKTCDWSQKILLETIRHEEFFSKTFNIDRKKFESLLVGTDSIFYPKKNTGKNNETNVLWYGTYSPLHGTDIIVNSAFLLKNENSIKFTMIGNGLMRDNAFELAKKNNAKINFLNPIKYEALPDEIAKADICLSGPFGTTEKAELVMLGKTFQMIAMKKPVILGKTLANSELFDDKKNCLMVEPGNPTELADAILKLSKDKKLREQIAQNALVLFEQSATPQKIGEKLKKIIFETAKIT